VAVELKQELESVTVQHLPTVVPHVLDQPVKHKHVVPELVLVPPPPLLLQQADVQLLQPQLLKHKLLQLLKLKQPQLRKPKLPQLLKPKLPQLLKPKLPQLLKLKLPQLLKLKLPQLPPKQTPRQHALTPEANVHIGLEPDTVEMLHTTLT